MSPAETDAAPHKPLNERFFAILTGMAIALVLLTTFWRVNAFSFFVYEDTYIVLRYAANFLTHGQLVWNLSEAVEGYTNPLHLALIVLLGGCGLDLLDAARLINAAAWLGFGALLFVLLRKQTGLMAALLVTALGLANPALIAWVWGGMEPPLSVLLLALAQGVMLRAFLDPTARNSKSALWCAVFFGLAFFNRPDNALFAVPAFFAWLLWRDWRNAARFAGIFGGMVIAHTVVRLIFYGEWLPNTFFAKVTGTPAVTFENGWRYVWEGLSEPPYYYAAGIIALAVLLFRKPRRGFALFALASIALGAGYVISIGGDFMPGKRFMLPWLPLCLMGLGLLLEKALPVFRYAGLVVCLLMMKALFILPDDLRALDGTALAGETTGRYIAQNWPRGSSVALNAAGAIPYFNMDKVFIDMLGLNDRHIAHRAMPDLDLVWQKKPGHGKGDGAYVLQRQPDFIILSSIAGDGVDTPVLPSDAELKVLPEFARCYKRETALISWPDIVLKQGRPRADDRYSFSYYRRICPKT